MLSTIPILTPADNAVSLTEYSASRSEKMEEILEKESNFMIIGMQVKHLFDHDWT